MILKNLWRRPTRSLLTILGIAIGVAAVVALGAMAEGMVKSYGTAIGMSTDLLVIQANALDPLFSSLDEEMAQRIEAVPGVEAVDPGVYTWIATDEMPFFLIFGYPAAAFRPRTTGSSRGSPSPDRSRSPSVAAPPTRSRKTVDDTVRLYGVPYRIVGIYETGQGMEESGGLVTLADGQDIAQKPRKVSLFQVGLRRNSDIDQVKRRIESLDKVLSVNVASEYNAAEQYAGLMQGYAWGIAAVAIIVGGLGMMNAMVMSVLERTREIGTLRALGWRRGQIVRMIMGEAVLLSLVGGVIGISIGVGLTELAERIPSIGAFMEGVYSPGLFAQGLITALILGIIGGAYPAWRAANLQPVEALRYEGGAGADGKRRSQADVRRTGVSQSVAPPHAHHPFRDRHRHWGGDAGDARRHEQRHPRPTQHAGRQRQHRAHHLDAEKGCGHEHEHARRTHGQPDPVHAGREVGQSVPHGFRDDRQICHSSCSAGSTRTAPPWLTTSWSKDACLRGPTRS